MLKFDLPKNQSNIIKVIGVGGGGSNAVTHMYKQGIKGVDFIICNTDAQAMESSPIPMKIQLGTNLTSGLGAGAIPSVGRNAALEDADNIRQILSDGTKMLFVTAGLGGGTGTGAAPVIAEISKELGILTVGIVTIPFAFEGRKRKLYADEGIKQFKEHVDALLIISNDKLRELYGNLRLSEAFGQADNILTSAARGIAEIITITGYINVDFEDVKTVMKDSGVAIMGTGISTGANRATQAVEEAISSPLLNNNDIEGANNLLLYLASGKEEITMDEVTEITDYIQEKTKSSTEVIWGNGFDESLGDKISVTIIATGFDDEHRRQGEPSKKDVVIRDLYETELSTPKVETRIEMPTPEQVITEPVPELSEVPVPAMMSEPVLEEEQEVPEMIMEVPEMTTEASEMTIEASEMTIEVPEMTVEASEEIEPEPGEEAVLFPMMRIENEVEEEEMIAAEEVHDPFQREIVFDLDVPQHEPVGVLETENEEEMHLIDKRIETITSESYRQPESPRLSPSPGSGEDQPELNRMGNDRIQKLKALSEKLKNHTPIENNLYELENIPAYKRRHVDLPDVALSSESQIHGLSLNEDAEKGLEIRSENSFLHKNVD
ncbi:MAG: cell division protein FtsZ [Bacteroidia bacterium]|nr:cell division protein FtsZ [Bacteroidia bacterium]